MHRLSDLGRRHLTDRPLRSVLVGASIALGVAVLLGVAAGQSTMQPGLDELTGTVGSKADVIVAPIGPIGSRLPADSAQRLAALDGVARAVPVQGTVTQLTPTDRQVFTWRTAVVTVAPEDADALGAKAGEGRLPSAPDEVAVDRHQAESLALALGDTIRLEPSRIEVEVVGYLDRGALTESGDGDVVFGVPQLAAALGLPQDPNQVIVVLDDVVDTPTWIREHRAELTGMRLDDIDSIRAPLEELFDGVLTALSGLSSLALLLAGYLIHLALSSSVAQRTRTYGTLLALGATRRQIRGTVVAEVLWLALASVAVGVVVGLGLARLLASTVADIFDTADRGLVVRPIDIVACAGAGLACAAGSSLMPARNAARSAPIAAIRGDAPSVEPSPWVTLAGVVTLVLAVLLIVVGSQDLGVFGTGFTLLGVGFVLPALLPRLAALISPLIRRLSPGMGEVAVAHVVKERSRSALTAGLLVGVLGITLLAGSGYSTLEPHFREYMERQYGADLQLDNGFGLADSGMPADYPDRLRALDGVESVTPLWYAQGEVAGVSESRVVSVIDPDTYFGPSGFLFVDGDEAGVRSALADGGILVPAILAEQQGWELGAPIELELGPTTTRLTLAGTYSSFGDDISRSLVIGQPVAEEILGGPLDGANEIRIDVRDGVDPHALAAQLPATGQPGSLRIRFGADNVDEALAQFNAVFGLFVVLQLLAAIVGLLGLANTMAISVLERTREIGVLRALGARVNEVRRMVFVEGLVLVAVAMVLGVGVSWLLARDIGDTSGAMLGFQGDPVYPWGLVPILAVAAAVASLGASLIPARRASRVDPCEVLRLE